jgi:hypothetical protein|tara:strand:- start:2066 stop:2446 length:381 start_codon:yes stop_codon:yes gene_type:complete
MNISIIENHIPNTNFPKLNLSGDTQDQKILNILAIDGSYNLLRDFNHIQSINRIPKTSRGLYGKKPGDENFSISSHISFLQKLKKTKGAINQYLYKCRDILKIDIQEYIKKLKDVYYYDIFSLLSN